MTSNTENILYKGLQSVESQADATLLRVQNNLNIISHNNTIIDITSHKERFSKENEAFYHNTLITIAKRYMGFNSYSPNIFCYMYLKNQNSILDSNRSYYTDIDMSRVDMLQKAQEPSNLNRWQRLQEVDFYTLYPSFQTVEPDYFISYLTSVKDESGKTQAILSANIDPSFLEEVFIRCCNVTGGALLVLDSDSNYLSHFSDSQLFDLEQTLPYISSSVSASSVPQGSCQLTIDKIPYLAVYSRANANHWTYVYLIPESVYLGNLNIIIHRFLSPVIFFTLIAVIIMVIIITNTFYNPIKRLVTAMKQIEERNLDYHITDSRKDEYSKIYEGFNSMVDELDNLIKSSISEKTLTQEAQIKLLQAQMDPHFIYNTLESIYSLAHINQQEEIAKVILALSEFFRSTLSNGNSDITLKESIHMIKNYLIIQNFRFGDKIQFSIHLPKELESMMVPKFALQAIIENSIGHGISQKTGIGLIDISISNCHDMLLISVKDNGIGMDRKTLDYVTAAIQKPFFDLLEETLTGTFALRSLNQQIKLRYGKQYGLTIDSVLREGTLVQIYLPYKGGDNCV